MPIIWKLLDSTIQVTMLEDSYLARERRPGESTDAAVLRLAAVVKAKIPALKDATASLVKMVDMPANRLTRNDWTLKVDGSIDSTSKS